MLFMIHWFNVNWKKALMLGLISASLTTLLNPPLIRAAPKGYQATPREAVWTDYKQPKAWPEDAFPLKVFIQPLPEKVAQKQEEYKAAIRKGMQAWNATGINGKPIFQETEDPNIANVTIGWVLDREGKQVGFERSFTSMPKSPDGKFRKFTRSELTFIVNRVTTSYIPFIGIQVDRTVGPAGAGEIEIVATHELGHSLGLGHNDDSKDIMYPVESSEVVINGFKFTSTTAFTDVTRKKLAAHYLEAFKDFSRADAATLKIPQAQNESPIPDPPSPAKSSRR
ncbi:MAG: matrixin family metalloprotease [Gloeobacterales cyanobacterium]